MDRKCNIIADNGCESKISIIKPNITEENLVKISNKGIYKRGLKDAESVSEAEISYSDGFIKVKYDDIQAVIKDDFKGVSCSCKSKTVCRHVITAFIILQECEITAAENPIIQQSEEKNVENSAKESEETSAKTEINSAYIKEVTDYMDMVMKKGIINCNSSDADISSQLAVKGENTIHNNISLMMRSFSMHIGKMLENSAEFSSVSVFHLVCRVYNTAMAVLANADNQEKLKVLCTDGKDSYNDRGILTFSGLGAYPWATRSGYTGVTAILYCKNDRKIYTYSSSITYIHENTKKYNSADSLEELFRNHAHWQNSASLNQISGSTFKLFGCKTNNSGRISSSKSTMMNVLGFNTYDKVEIMKLSAEEMLKNEEEYDYFSEKHEEKVCAVKFESFENVFYNKIRQVLEFDIYDGKYSYPCEIVWNEINKNGVSYIENISRKGLKSRSFIICRYYKGIFTPISIANDEKVRSFYFE